MSINHRVGFRFVPSDEELLNWYLSRKTLGLPLPCHIIIERDLYGERANPCDVFNDVNESYWNLHVPTNDKEVKKVKKSIYVFTKLKRVKSRIARTAGCGTWKGQTTGKKIIMKETGEEIGIMKMFTYMCNNGSKDDDDHWIMHEYSLSGINLVKGSNDDNYVVCRITREYHLKKETTNTVPMMQDDQQQPCLVDDQQQPCLVDDPMEVAECYDHNEKSIAEESDDNNNNNNSSIIEYGPPNSEDLEPLASAPPLTHDHQDFSVDDLNFWDDADIADIVGLIDFDC